MQKIESMRRFAHLDLDDDRLPDESVILQFHHFLETKQLTAMLFDVLDQRGYQLSEDGRKAVPPRMKHRGVFWRSVIGQFYLLIT